MTRADRSLLIRFFTGSATVVLGLALAGILLGSRLPRIAVLCLSAAGFTVFADLGIIIGIAVGSMFPDFFPDIGRFLRRHQNGLGCLWVIISLFGGVWLGGRALDFIAGPVLHPFDAHLNEYVFQVNASAQTGGPIRGKLVVIDMKHRQVDGLTFDLPKQIQPERPEDVRTIAWLERDELVVGRYTDGGNAVKLAWDLTLVDPATRRVLYRAHFWGGEPPERKLPGGSGEGSSPERAALDFLANYPRIP